MKKSSVHKRVAIFDIDGTIFRSSLLIELVEALVNEGIFPERSRKIYEPPFRRWLNRQGTYEEYINAVIEAFMQNLKGVSYEDFERIGLAVVEINKDKVYRYTRDLVKKLKKRGYFLLAISQSPKGLLDAFCNRLGFDKIYGRFYELGPSEKFTGEVVDLHLIANKANIVRRAVAKEKLTLKGSIGVGDTEGDIPMLELVDTAICFNPNQLLYRYAKMNKWKVVVERKDVIYEMK
ncbi:MAG: HAD-IB family hydrolase [Candidatus Taylorbacteria bacterium]|nr:HAD-IB family hydrolase [Candidatus Taylorbacteria bacterium]